MIKSNFGQFVLIFVYENRFPFIGKIDLQTEMILWLISYHNDYSLSYDTSTFYIAL